MNYKRYILDFFSLDRGNLLKFFLGFLLNLVLILILSIFLLFVFCLLTIITYKILVLFVFLIFGAKIYLNILLLFLLIVLFKLQSRRRYAKYFDAKISRYIKNQDKDGLNKYKMILMMLGVYFSISVLGLVVYRVSGNELSISNKSDIINIFIWATYLIAPIVAIWVFSNWKVEFREREKYKVLTDLEENLVNIEDSFVVLDNYVKISWDYKVFKLSRSRTYHNFYFDNTDYRSIFFSNNYLTKIMPVGFDVDFNCIEIMVENISSALKYYNNFIISRFKYEYYESDLDDFELYKYQLNLVKQKLSTAATLISSDIFDVKSNEIPVGDVNDWIAYFNSTKNESIAFDLQEFSGLSRNILREIKEMKNGLLKY
ncbi:hypothetical protein [Acinetobacter brisouii]|uniref:hypothetical protein n=1 Tax=Acinetobacter brisouii TaxID=396323 RepID=UPI0005F7E797|nr:hypothetical protein [Acinetobacter brisouii]KJV37904.1 hypothetical protein VH98_11050 [Acinetobacter brisouii]